MARSLQILPAIAEEASETMDETSGFWSSSDTDMSDHSCSEHDANKNKPKISNRQTGRFGVPYPLHKPDHVTDGFYRRGSTVNSHISLMGSEMNALQDMAAFVAELLPEPSVPSNVEETYKKWMELHPDRLKKRKDKNWAKAWLEDIEEDMNKIKEKADAAQATAVEDAKKDCDCGNFPFCSPVCRRRQDEKAACRCNSWPLCEVTCPLWKINYDVAEKAWEKMREPKAEGSEESVSSPERK